MCAALRRRSRCRRRFGGAHRRAPRTSIANQPDAILLGERQIPLRHGEHELALFPGIVNRHLGAVAGDSLDVDPVDEPDLAETSPDVQPLL